jgi:hypothetical protein
MELEMRAGLIREAASTTRLAKLVRKGCIVNQCSESMDW